MRSWSRRMGGDYKLSSPKEFKGGASDEGGAEAGAGEVESLDIL
jgi:hypothetical protein